MQITAALAIYPLPIVTLPTANAFTPAMVFEKNLYPAKWVEPVTRKDPASLRSSTSLGSVPKIDPAPRKPTASAVRNRQAKTGEPALPGTALEA